MFFPHLRHADYIRYERAVADMPGLHIHFDDLFVKPIETLAADFSGFLETPVPECNLCTEVYDMYGKLRPYDVAFKKFDDNVEFLRPATVSFLHRHAENGTLQRPITAGEGWLRFMQDKAAFRVRNGHNFL